MANWPPKKGTAFDLDVVIRDADGDPITDPAGLAAVISMDGGAQAATTNAPAVVSAGSAIVKLALTSTEMTADRISVVISSASAGAKSAFLTLYTDASQIAEIKTQTAAIEADTQDLQTQIGAAGAGLTSLGDARIANLDAAVSSRSSHVAADIWTVATRALTDKAGFTISGAKTTLDDLNDISAAQVNAEVVDALGVDTIPELAQGAPPATPTVRQALMLLYMALRNETLTTASLLSIKNDAGTVITKAALSDDATTMTKGKLAAGP